MAKSGDLKKILGLEPESVKLLAGKKIHTVDDLAKASQAVLRRIARAGVSMPTLLRVRAESTVAASGDAMQLDQFREALRSAGDPDDLTAIKGLSARAAEAFYTMGVFTYAKLASLTTHMISMTLKTFGIRTNADVTKWRREARRLAETKQSVNTPNGSSISGTGGVNMAEPIVFRDFIERDGEERRKLQDRRFILEQRKEEQNDKLEQAYQDELDAILEQLGSLDLNDEDRIGLRERQDELEDNKAKKNLTDGQKAELDEITALIGKRVVDPLFLAVQTLFERNNQRVRGHRDGRLPSQWRADPPHDLRSEEEAFAAVFGILVRDNTTNYAKSDFARSVALARGEYDANQDLFRNVLYILADEGDDGPRGRTERVIYASQLAAVTRQLVDQNVSANDIHLSLKVRRALSNKEADDEAMPSGIDIDLPDLEQQTNVEILADNLHAMQAIYFSAMLEELKLFQVVDKLIELFQSGMLPLAKGRAGDMLYRYMKKNVTRLSEYERRNLYARTLGHPGGEAAGNPNRDFQTLWLRFVSAVSSFARQMSLDNLLRSRIPARVHQEQVRKSARDLAANLSLYGYGMAYSAATELQTQIKEVIAMLSDEEVLRCYGARDMWGVVDQVAVLELGGARDSVRYRTMASSGAVIIRWLANHSRELAAVNSSEILDVNEINRPVVRSKGSSAMTEPLDSDVVNACERWLAVTGTPDAQIQSYSEPSESPATTSRPISIPSAARDALEAAGIGANGI
jgi:predicted flap endonuclease-1-like 5' DNA nuclease